MKAKILPIAGDGSPHDRALISQLPAALDLFSELEAGTDEAVFLHGLFAFAQGLFTAGWTFRSEALAPFVMVNKVGDGTPEARRRWRHDSFDALHSKNCGAILTNAAGERALVIPLNNRGRYIFLLRLREGKLSESEWAFIKALEGRARALRGKLALTGHATIHDVPSIRESPRLLWIGPLTSNADRVERLLGARGWALEHVQYTALLPSVTADGHPPDLVFLDAASVPSYATAIRMIRALGSPAVLLFTDNAQPVAISLAADAILSSESTDDTLFRTIKELFRVCDDRRHDQLLAKLVDAERRFMSATSRDDLARDIVGWLTQNIAEWVCLHAFSSDGVLLVVQPELGPRLPRVPETFLCGYDATCVRVDDRFIENICPDDEFCSAMRQLRPRSGASLLLTNDRKATGTIVCFSLVEEWGHSQLVILSRFGEIASNAMVRAERIEPKGYNVRFVR